MSGTYLGELFTPITPMALTPKEAIDKAEYYVHSHDYILQQVVSTDMYELLTSLDKMVKSDDPTKVFEKYKQLYTKMSRLNNDTPMKNHDFFE